jgi:hypothetical protein
VVNRSQIVWAILVLVRAWLSAGRPGFGTKLGMFENWSTVMGGIFQVVGIGGFLENLDAFYDDADAENLLWSSFLGAWWGTFRAKEVSVADLFVVLDKNISLPLGDGGEHSQKVKLGKLLAEMRDRSFEIENENGKVPLRIERGKQSRRAYQWRLVRSDQSSQLSLLASEDNNSGECVSPVSCSQPTVYAMRDIQETQTQEEQKETSHALLQRDSFNSPHSPPLTQPIYGNSTYGGSLEGEYAGECLAHSPNNDSASRNTPNENRFPPRFDKNDSCPECFNGKRVERIESGVVKVFCICGKFIGIKPSAEVA